MILQKQPNDASCLATAFAMCFNVDVKKIFKELGHDGTEVLWPQMSPPNCYRGFHYSELHLFGYNLGFSCIMFEPKPKMFSSFEGQIMDQSGNAHDTCVDLEEIDVTDFIRNKTGVIAYTSKAGHFHACAFHRGKIYNPSGVIEAPDDCENIEYLWLVV